MKKISNILKYICIVSLLFCFFPVLVFADNDYLNLTALECYPVYFTNSLGQQNNRYSYNFNLNVKAIAYRDNLGKIGYCFMSEEFFKYSSKSGITGCYANAERSNSNHYTANDYNFYYYFVNNGDFSIDFDTVHVGNEVLPFAFTNIDVSNNLYLEDLYDYLFNGVTPPEPVNWGLVRDPEYSTRIAGNGYAAKRNIDYLSWNNEVDSNGNDISECTINIKAVLGSWSGTSQEDLLNKTYNDFNIGSYSSIDLGSVSASSGLFSVSWQRIIDEAGWNFDSLYSHFEDNIFLKQGWYYQLQLVDPDGGIHQWQTLYTPLSSSAAASETVINHNSFDTSIYQVYQDLATINNNTSITINIQDTDYTVTNPDDGDEPSGGVDLWDILKQMLNGIFQIVKNIAALPGKFLEMIQQLITPPQQISEEINTNFNNNMQDLNESQPGLMESMNAVEDIQDTLNQSVNSFNGIPECIFTWDAVTMDLSAFNAGTVTFIAAGSFDFAASFMQMINGFGMTYSEYQFYVSAIIYAWILVFIYRHVYDFLAGTKEN